MAFSVTNIGTNAQGGASGATIAVTVPVGGVPSGSLIFVCTWDGNSTLGGSLADTASNSYSLIQQVFLNAVSTNGFGSTFYAKNATALVQNNTITYTKQTTNAPSDITACYVTGADTVAPLDTGATAKATGSSATPSVTSGTPTGTADLFIGTVTAKNNGTSTGFVQASGWATPPNEAFASTTGGAIDGGNQVGTGTNTLTYNPTITSNPWACFIQAFKAPAVITCPLTLGLLGVGC